MKELQVFNMNKILLLFLIFFISLYANTIEEAKELFDKKANYIEAIKTFKTFPNNSEAQYYLGKAYFYGFGIEKDKLKAYEYAKKSAMANNPSGLNLLGVLYQSGFGIQKDELQALIYYKQAANLGNAKAMRNIAQIYAGVGSNFIQKNYNESITWLKKAVETGDKESLKILANVLSSNQINRNEESLKYYNLYLDTNPKDKDYIYLKIGDAYKGLKSYSNAYKYYKRSAEFGNIDAILSIVYFDKKKIIPESEYLYWLKEGVKYKLDLVYLPLFKYYQDKKDYKNLKIFLTNAYYKDKQLQMGCALSSYYLDLSFEHPSDKNLKKTFTIASEITTNHPQESELYICYDNLAYLYRSGNFFAQDFDKTIEIYRKSFQRSKTFVKDEIAEYIAQIYLEKLEDYQNAQKWYKITYELTKDDKFLHIVDNYINSKPTYKSNNLENTKQKIYPIISNFTNKKQVASVLETNDYYFISLVKSIQMYDKKTLEFLKEFRGWIGNGIEGVTTQMAYDEEQQLLYCAGLNSTTNLSQNDIIKVFNINSGKIVKTISNKNAMKSVYLNISKDGKYLVSVNGGSLLNIIDTGTNAIQHYNFSNIAYFKAVNIIKKDDDYEVNVLSLENLLYTFSINQKRQIKKEPYTFQTIFKQFNGRHAEKILNKEIFGVKNIAIDKNNLLVNGQQQNQFVSFNFDRLNLSKRTHEIILDDNSSKINLIYKNQNATIKIYKNSEYLSSLEFYNVKALNHKIIDDKYIIVAISDASMMYIFNLEGRAIAKLEGFQSIQTNMIYKDGYLITNGQDNIINIWNLDTLDTINKLPEKYNEDVLDGVSKTIGGNILEMMDASDEDIKEALKLQVQANHLSYMPTPKQFRSCMKMFLSKKESIKPIASLFIKNEKDWIIYTPQGLFAYGGQGDKLLKYHQNQGLYKEAKIIENEKLFDKFYRPGLIKKILTGEKVDIPLDVKSVILNVIPPELKIIENKMINERDISLTYQVCNAGNGVANPKLIINGKAINPPSSRGFSIEKIESKDNKCKVYKSIHTLSPGENTIYLKAYDKDKNIASQTKDIKVTTNYKIETKPNLYFLSIAVSEYKDKSYNLKYPVDDAIKVKEQIEKESKFVYKNIYTFKLYNQEVTEENINKIFDNLKNKININDAFILYIAGHGVSIKSKYQFIPYDSSKTISIDTLKINLSKIETSKSLVLLDTCQSGTIIDNIIDETVTLNRLSQDDNRNYIVASSKNQIALEGYKNHGVFTYSVLNAFLHNSNLKVWGLADYISEIVPKITKEKFQFEQQPQAKLNKNFILTGDKK